jgi:hypothetical protein
MFGSLAAEHPEFERSAEGYPEWLQVLCAIVDPVVCFIGFGVALPISGPLLLAQLTYDSVTGTDGRSYDEPGPFLGVALAVLDAGMAVVGVLIVVVPFPITLVILAVACYQKSHAGKQGHIPESPQPGSSAEQAAPEELNVAKVTPVNLGCALRLHVDEQAELKCNEDAVCVNSTLHGTDIESAADRARSLSQSE